MLPAPIAVIAARYDLPEAFLAELGSHYAPDATWRETLPGGGAALDWSVGGTQTLVGVAVVLSAEFFALLRAGWRRVRASSRSAV